MHSAGESECCIYGDIANLHRNPTCLVHGKQCQVGLVNLAVAGFSCKTLSRLNAGYAKGECRTSLRDGTGSSGETFHGLLQMLQRFEPPVYVGENVEDLALPFSDNRQALLEAPYAFHVRAGCFMALER